MELIKAQDAPRVGVAELDEQHAALIDLINRLHRAMIEREDRETLAALMAELVEDTQQHFAYEEQLMSRHRYPEYASHKADHDTTHGADQYCPPHVATNTSGLDHEPRSGDEQYGRTNGADP